MEQKVPFFCFPRHRVSRSLRSVWLSLPSKNSSFNTVLSNRMKNLTFFFGLTLRTFDVGLVEVQQGRLHTQQKLNSQERNSRI